MATSRVGTELANVLRETWDSNWHTFPTEESVIADFVDQPVGTAKVGSKLHLRKVGTIAATTFATSDSGESLTATANTEIEVQATPVSKYAMTSVTRQGANQIIDDAGYSAALRKQMLAGMDEAIDTSLFTLAASATYTESSADIDKPTILSAIGKLSKNGKGHIRLGANGTKKVAVVYPDEIKNLLGISDIMSAQVRGDSQNPTVKGWVVDAFGVEWRESGLVYVNAGTAYNPLLDKNAWVLAWNEKPHILEAQPYQLNVRLIAYSEYAVKEMWTQYLVSINTTV